MSNPQIQGQIFSHGYALLIGVGESSYPNWSLPVTVDDINAIFSVLTDPNLCGYINDDQHICRLVNNLATKQAITDGLHWLQQQVIHDENATALVFYSGHGWMEESTGRYYLIPHDVNPHRIGDSSLSSSTLGELLGAIPAKRLLVVVDSCHAEGMATTKGNSTSLIPNNYRDLALPKNIIEELAKGEGRAVFASSRGSQSSWILPDQSLSVYTYHFVEALRGAGSQPENKTVNVSHIMRHLGESVPETALRLYSAVQTPFFDFRTEDFPIALLVGGKGLPMGDLKNQLKSGHKKEHISITGDGNIVSGSGNVVNISKTQR